jgi:hypothetical protein
MEYTARPATRLAPNTLKATPDVSNTGGLTTFRKDDDVPEDESQNDTFRMGYLCTFPGRVLGYISLEREGADYACFEPTKQGIS